jgi:hypothetical protein
MSKPVGATPLTAISCHQCSPSKSRAHDAFIYTTSSPLDHSAGFVRIMFHSPSISARGSPPPNTHINPPFPAHPCLEQLSLRQRTLRVPSSGKRLHLDEQHTLHPVELQNQPRPYLSCGLTHLHRTNAIIAHHHNQQDPLRCQLLHTHAAFQIISPCG